MIITLEIDDRVYELLKVLTRGEFSESMGLSTVEDVVSELIDHAQQGVYRPGAWERGWLCQAFADDWTEHVEPDPTQKIPGSIGGIGRNDMPFDRPKK